MVSCQTTADAEKGSYIYMPEKTLNPQVERQSKRIKLSKVKSSQKDHSLPFACLLDGHENEESVRLRYATFQQFWASQEQEVQV